ncbi:mechanosensitive ion channel family protein [Hymenobacter rubripertinctus]|uniref:Mechanosensitive ion channel family protein n=1 Tax=Hymenobacter rubripertinctus TaxID=2029981 RepID=A0A418R7C8_9BACT|nr:mechanosensitive ion channel family protein [Hymenobacter rubripertinctus]RIY13289.1 mechanosensitive ion channel family protein [Hymenobacter rubripertinctus]
MTFRLAWPVLVLWLGMLVPALAQVIPPPMKQAPRPASPGVVLPGPATPKDSARSQGLVTDTETLRRIDSLRRANSGRLEQIQTELLTLKNSSTDKRRERDLITEIMALRQVDSLRQARARQYIDSLKQYAKGFPVAPHGDTLFYVYTKLGPFSPRERAQLTEDKIKRLQEGVFFSPDSLLIYPSEQTTDLMYGQQVLQSINQNDALWQNVSRDSLARAHRARIIAAVVAYKDANSLKSIAKEIGLTLLVLIVLYFTVKYVIKLFRWVRLKLRAKEGTWFRGIKFGNYEFFNEQRQLSTVLLLATVLQWIVVLLTIYLVLPIVFSIFPGTQGIADTLLGYVFNPLKKIGLAFWNYLPNLFTIAVIVAVFRYVLKAIYSIKEEIREGNMAIEGFYADWANPTYQIVRVLVFAFALVVIFPYLPGSDSPVFQGVSVFLGFLFTFGSAGSLSNIVAGLVLTYMRAYKIGDRVRIGDVTGDIVEKTLLVTRIRTVKNEEITIPNSSVMSSYTTNFSTAAPTLGLVLHTTVTIGYDVPWKQVHQLLLEAARASEFVLAEPQPFVLQTSLDDYYVAYQLNAYTREAGKQSLIYSLLHQNIQDKFNEAGVEIMSPHFRAVRDGSSVNLPAQYLPKDYQAPKFRVENSDEPKG